MSNLVPFAFCRYAMMIGDDVLDANATFQALSEVQGNYFPHGPKAERENVNSIVVMRPRLLDINGEQVVTWALGNRPGHRTVTDYDRDKQEIKYAVQRDSHIFFTSMIAIPRLNVMAVQDRVNALNMDAKPALRRTRSLFRHMEEGAFTYSFLKPGDVAAIVGKLDLSEFSYTVRRINPTPPGVLSAALDATFAADGIGINRGVAKPMPGETMKPDGGFIAATTELAEAGYGVLGFKGKTDEGRLAHIRKPAFSMDKKENLEQMQKETPLRVFFESDDEDDALLASVVAELMRFYDGDDAPKISQEPA